jgi:PKD repeat protein
MSFSFARRAAVAVAILSIIATVGCTVHNRDVPALTGPSALALSLSLNAIPDSISQDGGSQASIKVLAIGPNGKPVSALAMRVDMVVGGVPQDFGTLSARTIVTNADGVATVVFTAPPSPPDGVFGTCNGLPGTCISIVATPTGTNFETANSEGVTIRLVPPGVILPPPDTPTASFQFSPAVVGPNQAVTFDGSSSCGGTLTSSGACPATQSITQYNWNFGDGSTGSGAVVSHSYANVASYTVTLTVTNGRGVSASTTKALAISPSALPTANFTTSPTAIQVSDPVFFNATSSTVPPGRTIRSYDWDFGDGSPHGSGVLTTHAYAVVNTYKVTLTVTDDIGQQGISAKDLPVGTGVPSASLLLSKIAGTTVQADASGSSAQGTATITTYTFAWGDGSPNTTGGNAVVQHDFPAPVLPATTSGPWTVSLRVTDSVGRTATTSATITVP